MTNIDFLEIVPVADEKAMETRNAADKISMNSSDYEMILGGIVFSNNYDMDGGNFPSLDYKIRFNEEYTSTETNFIFPPFQEPGPSEWTSMTF